MNKIKLSNRLYSIASLVNKGDIIQDIGTDHALVPIFLIKNNIIEMAIASEVNKGPYLIALESVKRHNLEDKIKVILSDGLQDLKKEVNTVLICGMGGLLIKDILDKGIDRLSKVKTLILAPNSNQYELRVWIANNNYLIEDEIIVKDADKYYEIIKAVKSDFKINYTKEELLFGPILFKEKNNVFIAKWDIEIKKIEKILNKIKDKQSSDYFKISFKLDFIRKMIY